MEIEYLTYLRDNPERRPGDSQFSNPIEPISLSEIEALETKYNNGKPFPKALRELLFLAGNDCYVLDYGLNETQEEFQEDQRQILASYYQEISNPYYIIDCHNYGTTFLFIYLDEGDNPLIRELKLGYGQVRTLKSLKDFINSKIDMVKQGINPF